MSLIDRAATFRGKVVGHGVSLTTNEWPQFVLNLVATEIYDDEEKVWVDWTDVEQNEITAYVVLIGKNGETPSFNQIKKIFNWDGAAFRVLDDGDYSEVGIQFRVEEDTYLEKTRLKVAWIDEYDAEPGRSVRKLNPDEMKKLDAKYAQLLKASGAKATPAKAKGTITKKGIKPTSPKGPVTKKDQTATEATSLPSKDITPSGTIPNSHTVEKSVPPALADLASQTTAKPAMPVDDLPAGHCTKNEAWDEVVGLRDKKVDDKMLAESWAKALKEVGNGKAIEKFTDEDFFQVKEKVNAECALF